MMKRFIAWLRTWLLVPRYNLFPKTGIRYFRKWSNVRVRREYRRRHGLPGKRHELTQNQRKVININAGRPAEKVV